MKAKKQTERLIVTVTFEVFESADGKIFSSLLTRPEGLIGLAATNMLETHLYRLRAGALKLREPE